MNVEVNNSEEFHRMVDEAQAQGRHVLGLKRGKTNGQWLIEVSEAPAQPELLNHKGLGSFLGSTEGEGFRMSTQV
jgi:hypothetical protein